MSQVGPVQHQASSGGPAQCSPAGPVTNGSFAGAGRVEGIEHADTAAGKVGDFASDQNQSPGLSGGGQEAVDDGEWVGNIQAPPFFRDASVDIDDVILVYGPQAVQPLLQQVGLGTVLAAQAFDAQPDLADCQCADKDLRRGDGVPPGHDIVIWVPFADLGDDIGVEQVGHASPTQSMVRGRSWDLARSRSPKSGPDRR